MLQHYKTADSRDKIKARLSQKKARQKGVLDSLEKLEQSKEEKPSWPLGVSLELYIIGCTI